MIVEKMYLNIIVDAESKIFEGESRNKLLSDYYIDAFKRSKVKKVFYTNLLKVIEVFKEDIEGQRHEHIILMDIIPEVIIGKTIKIDLNKYQPDKKHWRFDYELEEYRVKQHKKSIKIAQRAIIQPVEPQQVQESISDEVKKELHNNIFRGNAIDLFEKYFKNKLMTVQSRTDFRFLFNIMKTDKLIYDTVSLSQYISFIGKYGYVEKELKAIEMNADKNIQRAKDYNEYKDNLKITLK
tara:strand:- start:1573 stop:2289 length:717 start_codon:yes stop_codon:yes gene_type:complete